MPTRHVQQVVEVLLRLAGPLAPCEPMHKGTRHFQDRADRRHQASGRRQCHNDGHHDLPLLADSRSLSSRSAATFFRMAMIASA